MNGTDKPQTAVVTTQPQPPATVKQPKAPMGISHKGIVLSDLAALWRFSEMVAKSGLAPKGIETPEAICVAVQMGLEIGLTPMASLQNIAVINGRPSLWGDAQLGVVRASRLLEKFDEGETNDEIDPVFRTLCFETDLSKRQALKIQIAQMQAKANRTADDFGVTVFVQREGYNETFSRFTIADAKKANLWGKTGPWSQYPARMLKFRARSFVLRDQFGDALKGLLEVDEAKEQAIEVQTTAEPQFSDRGEAVAAELDARLANAKQIAATTEKPEPEKPKAEPQFEDKKPGNVETKDATPILPPLPDLAQRSAVDAWLVTRAGEAGIDAPTVFKWMKAQNPPILKATSKAAHFSDLADAQAQYLVENWQTVADGVKAK